MILRLIIDVLRNTMELREAPGGVDSRLTGQPPLWNVRVNRFIPTNFVFRCKVVASRP